MPRSPLAYLSDIIEACDAIDVTLDGVDLARYETDRTIRSSVEREFTIIGEAVNSLSRLDSEMSTKISHARKIVGFRNQLIHDYAAIIDSTVWAIADHDVSILRRECQTLMETLGGAD